LDAEALSRIFTYHLDTKLNYDNKTMDDAEQQVQRQIEDAMRNERYSLFLEAFYFFKQNPSYSVTDSEGVGVGIVNLKPIWGFAMEQILNASARYFG
jgi:hypothetical protein